MTTASSGSSCEDRSACTDGRSGTNSTESEDRAISWATIVPIVLIGAVVLLVGLPLGTVWIMNSSNCCLADGSESTVTFWASMTAGFLTLFGMVVTAVFIITAFRVDATARDKAQVAAQDEVWKYIDHYEERLAQDLMDLKVLAKEMLGCVDNQASASWMAAMRIIAA